MKSPPVPAPLPAPPRAGVLTRLSAWAKRRSKAIHTALTSSLATRVSISTFVISATLVTVVITGVVGAITDRVFSDAQDTILSDAAYKASSAQSTADSVAVQSAGQVQPLAYELISMVGYSGEVHGALIMRAPGETSQVRIAEPSTDAALRPLISSSLRAAVGNGDGHQYWQSISLPVGDRTVPGIAVGSNLYLPGAGQYELYLIYSLEQEQQTINTVFSVLTVGSGLLLVLVVVLTWVITQQVLRPVRQVAGSARRLAAGELSERAVVSRRDELGALAISFNKMADSLEQQVDSLEELSRLQQRFVSDVSHELRTPMTTMRMAAELLHTGRSGFPPAAARTAELLYNQVDRFDAMLADLLEISRFDSGSANLNIDDVDLAEVIDSVIVMTAPLAQSQQVEIICEPPEKSRVVLSADRLRLERIVRNFVVNAIEHAEGRPVHLTWAANDSCAALRVADHGIGLTPSDIRHVFDRFWRADPARARTTGGTGLGLSISREDAALHGGWVDAWGIRGRGASFRVVLPLRHTGPTPDPHQQRDTDALPARRADLTPPLPLIPAWLKPEDNEDNTHDDAAAPPADSDSADHACAVGPLTTTEHVDEPHPGGDVDG